MTDTNWKVVGTTDFTEDGQADILWQHEDGRISLWSMNSTTMTSGFVLIHNMSLRTSTGEFARLPISTAMAIRI